MGTGALWQRGLGACRICLSRSGRRLLLAHFGHRACYERRIERGEIRRTAALWRWLVARDAHRQHRHRARWRGDYREPVRYDRNVRFSARVASRCQGRDRSRCGMARFEQIEGGRRVTRKAGAHVHLAFTNKILQHCSTASHMVFVLLQYSSVALRRTSKVL